MEGALAVVPERRVPEVVRERSRLGDVGVGAEGARQVAGDLGDLETVGEPVADEVVALRTDHLGLGREPAERRRVDDAGAVALERLALRCVDPLRRLGDDPLAVGVAVPLLDEIHRRDTTAHVGSPPVSALVWLPFEPELLGDPPSALRYEVVDPTVAVPDSVSEAAFYVPPYQVGPRLAEVMDRMSGLQVVQTLTAGVDNLRDRVPAGVSLCSGRGIHDASTAELAVTLLLSSLRGIPGFVRAQDEREWAPGWRPALADKRVLIVGYGAVGQAIEARLAPFEVDVVAVARSARDGVHGMAELPTLLPDADVVVLIVPLTSETRGLVDEHFLARLKDGALLVNVARGPVVVTDDLVAALGTGRIAAAIDVVDPEPLPADHPLWHAPNLLISPHVGGASSAMWPRAYRLVRDQLHRFAAGEELANVVVGDY